MICYNTYTFSQELDFRLGLGIPNPAWVRSKIVFYFSLVEL